MANKMLSGSKIKCIKKGFNKKNCFPEYFENKETALFPCQNIGIIEVENKRKIPSNFQLITATYNMKESGKKVLFFVLTITLHFSFYFLSKITMLCIVCCFFC